MDQLKKQLNQRPTQVILSIALIVIFIFAYNRYVAKPSSPLETTNTPPIESNITTITQDFALFATESVLPERRFTVVKFALQFEQDPGQIWLSANNQPGTNGILSLVYHPMLEQLDWDRVEQPYMTLYQRKHTYDTIEQFVQNPPESRIAADGHLIFQGEFDQVEAVTSLSELQSLDDVDFILTTYHPLEQSDGYYYYTGVLDTSNALIDPDSQTILWKLDIENASESNPVKIGDIHVDFRQQSQ